MTLFAESLVSRTYTGPYNLRQRRIAAVLGPAPMYKLMCSCDASLRLSVRAALATATRRFAPGSRVRQRLVLAQRHEKWSRVMSMLLTLFSSAVSTLAFRLPATIV